MKLKSFLKQLKLKEFILITIGVAISSFAFSFFLNINNINIGGVSGISIILKEKCGFDPAISAFIINALLLIIGFIFLGKEFLVKNAYGSLMYPVFIKIFDLLYKPLSNSGTIDLLAEEYGGNADMMLIIIFSSIIMGIGLGIVLKCGASTGGTETPQNILYKYFHIPYSVSLYLIDGSVILIGFIILKQETNMLLYELIFAFVDGFIMDEIVFSGFNKRAIYIISDKIEEVKEYLIKELDRGVTSIKVVGEFTKQDRKMLMCIMSSKEYMKFRDRVAKIDPKAFYYSTRANEVKGEGFSYEFKKTN